MLLALLQYRKSRYDSVIAPSEVSANLMLAGVSESGWVPHPHIDAENVSLDLKKVLGWVLKLKSVHTIYMICPEHEYNTF